MTSKRFYLETMGCQMNKLDSELVVGQLSQRGYQPTDDINAAGVIIYNTCSVRAHAEDKVVSKIGQLRRRRREQKDFVLAIIGCMAERRGRGLLDEFEQVDVVCGPGELHRLGELIEHARQDAARTVAQNDPADLEALEALDGARQGPGGDMPFAAYVRVMRGCNKFCHYCIVPYVRGREQSRPLAAIVAESRRLVAGGVKEITLLGQTVNSYRFEANGRRLGLADVLEAVHDIDGLERLRFVTSYPTDFDERIFQAMAALPKVCPYLHIPAQSGSDRILRAMNRHYTAGEYVALIERARERVPELTVAGDFIVGYPGETDADFEATCELVRQVRYKNCFVFKYSVRPGTLADRRLQDDIPEAVKKQRNITLLELQNEIAARENRRYVGRRLAVLVEGPSKKPHLDAGGAPDGRQQLVGRTGGDHIAVFPAAENLAGRIVDVEIERSSALTLFGRLVSQAGRLKAGGGPGERTPAPRRPIS